MGREELVDNVTESARRHELVTLTLRPVRGVHDVTMRGRIIAVAEHYTGRRTLQVVLDVEGGVPQVIGLTMIKDFRIGR